MRTHFWLIAVASFASGILAWSCGSEGNAIIPDVDGGEGGASSSSGSSGNTREAGANGVTADGGVNPTGAGPGGNTSQIACGATTCSIPAEMCCVSQTANGRAYACVAGATCPAPAGGGGGGGGGDTTALKCTSAANCATGTVCCVTQNNGVTSAQCATTCGGGGGGGDTAQLCDPAAGDAGGCPASAPCSSNNIGDWGLPNTFGTCGGRGN